MYYEARYYDPLLARFAQADTIVPEAGSSQGLNRYSYVGNSPLSFIDPTGHCRFDAQGKISRFDCSIEDFDALSFSDRIRWMRQFMVQFNLPGMFNNVVDIMNWISESAALNYGVSGSWASWADAGVMESIQNGIVLYSSPEVMRTSGSGDSDAAHLWYVFFFNVAEGSPEPTWKSAWMVAERASVAYGKSVADAKLGNQLTGAEASLASGFFELGDFYRAIGSQPNGWEKVGGEVGSYLGLGIAQRLCNRRDICTAAGTVIGMNAGYRFSKWFTDPRTQLPSNHGPTYYAAKLFEAHMLSR
jgi:hypothetical protein